MSDAANAGAPRADVAPNTDDAPTIISSRKPVPATGATAFDAALRGRQLGPYEIGELIGVGGMAAVVQARDTALDRPVALKILLPELAQDAEHVARFQSEARAAARLDHENIARVFGCGQDQGLHFIAFEFVEGRTLRDRIAERGKLAPAEALAIARQAAAGLAHAAARGVVHRDLKPSNLIVTPDGRAKIVDMGLARRLDAVGAVTQPGVTLGTFDYMAPEQAIEPRAADTRSDIYSLGCTLYHALTGRPPIPDGTVAQKLHHHQRVPPTDPRSLNPDIPDFVVTILGRMMAKDPADRYQSADELLADLRAAERRLNPDDDAPRPLWAETRTPRSVTRWMLIASAASMLGVTVLVALMEMLRPPAGPGFQIVLSSPRSASEVVPAGDGPPALPAAAAAAPEPPRPAENVHAAANAEELRDLFAEADGVLRIRLTSAHYDLTSRAGAEPAGLTFRGKRLEIETEDPTRTATIRWTPAGDDRAALAVSGRDGQPVEVLIRGVRFQCAGSGERALAAIAASDLRQIDIERCAFQMPAPDDNAPAAVAVSIDARDGGDGATVRLIESLFARGDAALLIVGRGSVTAANCAFGPHPALIQIRGSASDVSLRLEHCSALLDRSTVVCVEDGAAAWITAGHCLFSRPEPADAVDPPGEAVLIRQTGGRAGEVTYLPLTGPDRQTLRNAYHNLSAFWIDETAGGPSQAVTLDDARRRPAFYDDDGLELPQSPWVDPRPVACLADGDERRAFAIQLRLARLRLPRAPLSGTFGVQRNVWGPSFARLDPPIGDAQAARLRIVDPVLLQSDPADGRYPTLSAALADARPGDTIFIKKSGGVVVEPASWANPDGRVTIRPFPGYRPVLTLHPTADSDASMIRILDGAVRFEGLRFALRATGSDARGQAIAALTGPASVAFLDCAITLDQSGETPLAAVLIPESDAMRTPGQRAAPSARFDSCFVRGKGDLVAVRGGRRFELDVDASLVALDGDLVESAGSPRDPPSAAPSAVRLRRVTARTEHVLQLRIGRDEDRRPIGLPSAVQIACDGCLIAAGGGRPLVFLEGVESDEQVRQLVSWTAPGDAPPTFYANVGPALLDVEPAQPDRMPLPGPFDRAGWRSLRSAASRSCACALPPPDPRAPSPPTSARG